MGFMDKAKKIAEQAQTKLDEAQKQFNERQGSGGSEGGPAVEYDEHGRPVGQPAPPPAPAQKGPTVQEERGDSNPEPPHGDPLTESAAKAPAPPSQGSGMTSGDPLGG